MENKIACVIVGFPATPIVSARVRFCLSASHTLEQIDYVLDVTDKLGDILALRHSFQNSESNVDALAIGDGLAKQKLN